MENNKPIVDNRPQNSNYVEIDLVELIHVLLMHWRTIFLSLLVGAVIFASYHVFMVHPVYQADAEMFITNTESVISFSDLQLSAALTDDYVNIITSRNVLKKVIKELDLNTDYTGLRKLVSVSIPNSTHIVKITVTCDDLELSRDITNSLLKISVEQINQIVGGGIPTIIDYAEAEAVRDVSPGIVKYVMMGALIGAILSCAIIIILWLRDSTIKSEDDIQNYLELPVLACVPYYEEKKPKRKK